MPANAGGKQNLACCGGQAVRLGNKVRGPLCGVPVDVNSPYRLDREGRSPRFCSEACREDYTRALQGEAVPGVTFECVMHPETRQGAPGECAVCGVALLPVRKMSPDATGGQGAGMLGRLRSALRF